MKLLPRTTMAAGLLLALSSFAPAHAADPAATVNVALLDMSSIMDGRRNTEMHPGWGWGMMGGSWMLGRGHGMLGMMSIRLDRPAVQAGTIHFNVINWSRAVVHELLIVAVDNAESELPYNYEAGKVPEEQVKSLGEVDKLKPNELGTVDVTLPAGNYLLLCNVEGHYASGMVTALSVTP